MANAEITTDDAQAPAKRSRLPLILGMVLAIALGAGGFFAVYSGMILATPAPQAAPEASGVPLAEASPKPDVAFVPVDPLVISLGRGSATRHLRFRAELEVATSAKDEVTRLLPRVLDVLNGYLRAVSLADLEEPAALIRLRAQMLRRVMMVTGEGQVRDLLIMEFVLN